jgi:hypothetical protein
MAWQILSERSAASARARIRQRRIQLGRDQRIVLFAATTFELSALVCRDARRFLFAVKGGRFITHMKKLRDVEVPLANFFASGVLALREKLGPILWQLPPNLAWDEQRLSEFLKLLPRNTREAANLWEETRQ